MKKSYLLILLCLVVNGIIASENNHTLIQNSQSQERLYEVQFDEPESTGDSYEILSDLAEIEAINSHSDAPLYKNTTARMSEFISIWNTTEPGISNDDQITIPINPIFTYDYTVDWGDGQTDTNVGGEITHTYATQGTYTITITGNFPAIYFNSSGDRNKIIEILQWGDNQWSSMENAFYGCGNLNFDAIDTPDLSQVSSLKNMFRNAVTFNGIINNWNVSTITDISGMFFGAVLFNRPLDNWNVSNVTDMSDTFHRANSFNEPLDSWNTASVTTMANMFNLASDFNQNINSWNVGRVVDMSNMFSRTFSFNFPLNNWNVSNVTNMSNMFSSSSYNQPLTSWNVSNVVNMEGMFARGNFNQNIEVWDVSSVTNMSRMFDNNRSFNQPINDWDVSNVTDMSEMFIGFSIALNIFNQPLNDWDVGNVTNMDGMFESSAFNQPIDAWNVSNVTTMRKMFKNAENFNQPLNSWDVSNVIDMTEVFMQAENFNQPLDNWNVTSVTSMRSMFNRAENFNQPLNNWNVNSVETMLAMFYEASAFNQSLGDWNVSSTFTMDNMLSNSGLSRDNYDATLIGWSSLSLSADVNLGASNLTYCDGRFARQDIVDNFNWTISGDQIDCDFVLCTSLISPMDGDTRVPANFNLVWNPISAATGYRLIVRVDSGGTVTTILDNVDVGNVTSFDFPIDFIPGDIVFATVIPFDTSGPATGCEEARFIIVPNFSESSEAFKLTYDTRIVNPGATPTNQLRIDTNNDFTYNYSIDWGDGQFDNDVTEEIIHTYETPGIYTIAIIGQYPTHFFRNESRDNRKLLTIDQWGTQVWQSMKESFVRCANMTYNATDIPNLSQVTDMSEMFRRATLFNGDINNWNVSNVTNMSGLFSGFTDGTEFNQPLNNWDVSNVTDMSEMFENAFRFDQNINNWNVSNVTDMSEMFGGSFNATVFNQPLNNWDVSSVTNMRSMFINNALFNQPINNWEVSAVTDMSFMFFRTLEFNQPIEDWNVSNVTTMARMFEQALVFNQPIDNWNVGNVIAMNGMFNRTGDFNQPLNSWNVGSVTNMESMFRSAVSFDQPIDGWNVASVATMKSMFESAESFNQPINSWNVTSVTTMESMFKNSIRFNQPIGNWNVSQVLTMESMFESAESFDQPIGSWDVNSVVNMASMFKNAQVFNQPINNWDVSAVADMSSMFENAQLFNQPIGDWDVSSVTLMNSMFENAQVFNQPINNWEVASVTRMDAMFKNALVFDSALGNWDTGEVLTMEEMFSGTTVFNRSIDTWNVAFVTTMEAMFQDAVSYDQSMNSWNVASVTTMERMFSGATVFNGAIDNWNVRSVNTMNEMFDNAQQFNQTINSWRVVGVATMDRMFRNAISYDQSLDRWDLGSVSMQSMFEDAQVFNQNLGDWNISQVTDMTNMLDNTAVSRTNYDNTLIAWSEQSLNSGITLGALGVPYCDALEERQSIIDNFGWTIIGDVLDCPIPECTQLVAPLNGAVDVPVNTNLTWEPALFARGYRITVRVEPAGTIIVNDQTVTTTSFEFATDFLGGETVFVTIIPFNDTGDAVSCAEESFVITNDSTPTIPNCTTLVLPLDGATNVAITTDLEWNPITNADGYRITAGTTSGGNDIIDNIDVGNVTTFDLPTDLPENTTIFLTIAPYNEIGNATGCVEENFTTEIIPVPPTCTTLTDPLNGATGVPVDTNISWNATPNTTGYLITVSLTPGGIDVINNLNVGNVTTFDLPEDLPENRTVFVTIIPFNEVGDATGCTEESFTTAAIPTIPNCTTLVSPINGATNVAINTDISWNSISDATGYRITIGTTSGGNDIIDNQDVGNVTTFDIPTDLPENTTIFVTITPYNSTGDASGCTEESFTTETAANIPNCTTLVSPVNGATNVAIDTDISWNNISDATGYRITIGTTSGGNDIIDNQDVGNVTTFDIPTDLPENTTIFVTITPYNSTGDASGCTEESFTTETAANIPNCTTLVSPVNGATNVAIDTDISWNNISDATGYRITIGTTSGGNDIIDNQDVGNVTTFDIPTDLPENTTIFVTITPYNATGDATGCTEESFTTAAIPTIPNCTTLVSPVNGANNVAIDTDISWNNISDATGYRITIGTASGGNDIIDNQDVGNITTFDLPTDLPENTTIFVTIIPYNSIGDASGCTEESFTTETAANIPNCISLSSPINGDTNVAIDTDISWNGISNATGYRITIGTTPGGNDIIDNQDVGNVTTFDLPTDLPENTTIFVTITPYNSIGNASGCTEESFTTELAPFDDDTKYGFSPDGDGINEFWRIDGIENYPDNIVTIYNRLGNMIFQIKGYNNTSRVFNGEANRLRNLGADELPEGTYFFNISINGPNNLKKLKGFLVLKR